MQTNKKDIVFSGSVEVPNELEMGQAVAIVVIGEVQDIKYSNNHDGTVNAKYIVKSKEARLEYE